MCAVSMIMQHYEDKWRPLLEEHARQPISILPPVVYVPPISQGEIDEFRKLLERAREYDRKHNQPDCELDEKRQTIKKIAEQLGVEVAFV